jgi:hypothetical protein
LLAVVSAMGAVLPITASAAERPPLIVLAQGRIAGLAWYASVEPLSTRRSGVVCVHLVTRQLKTPNPEFEFSEGSDTVCRSLSPREGPTIVTEVVESASSEGSINVLLAADAVKRVDLFTDHGLRQIRLQRVGSDRAEQVGLSPFRFSAFDESGDGCIRRVVSYGAGQKVLYRSARTTC